MEAYEWVLTVQNQPTTATDNVAFSTPVVVEANDGRGPVAGATITAEILSGSGNLIGSVTAVTNGSGVATFSTLGIDDSAF